MSDLRHALPPINSPRRIPGTALGPRCGDAWGQTALFREDVTCPRCNEQIAADAIRSGLRMAVEKGQAAVGLAVMDLCVWEGRGDWATLADEFRDRSAMNGLGHLNDAISALETQRDRLRKVLQNNQGE